MDESEDNMSADDSIIIGSSSVVKNKPKKRSLVERELETNLTARVTSPVSGDGISTSRYGRARRLKNDDAKKSSKDDLKSPISNRSPSKPQSPAYKMHASNTPLKSEPPAKIAPVETYLENQIESIYQENKSLSRFAKETVTGKSPAKKFPKVYIRKDLIQTKEPEETILLIKNMFSPVKSAGKSKSHLNNVLERSSEKYTLNKPQNGYLDNSSVVKTLDFDGKKKTNENADLKSVSKSDLFDIEAKCLYQVGDLAWARMGTYPFWPCIVTREPISDMFVKKKLFGRIERDVIHVTFFGDNGRRSWIVENMLRKYLGQLEFETTREKFTTEDKKRDPRLYSAFFISEKKQVLWSASVEEAEQLLREPKRLRIEIFNDILEKTGAMKTTSKQKSGKITRTDSDVSLSESLYDSLFSEADSITDNRDRSRSKSRNKSLDVSEVVTACLDNMAAKTGITKIQRQSHMDRWLQKAKSKTPEKSQVIKSQAPVTVLKESSKNKNKYAKTVRQKPYSLRKSVVDTQNLTTHQNEHDYSRYCDEENSTSVANEIDMKFDVELYENSHECPGSGIGIIAKVETLVGKPNIDSDECAVVMTEVNDDFIVQELNNPKQNTNSKKRNKKDCGYNSVVPSDNLVYMDEPINVSQLNKFDHSDKGLTSKMTDVGEINKSSDDMNSESFSTDLSINSNESPENINNKNQDIKLTDDNDIRKKRGKGRAKLSKQSIKKKRDNVKNKITQNTNDDVHQKDSVVPKSDIFHTQLDTKLTGSIMSTENNPNESDCGFHDLDKYEKFVQIKDTNKLQQEINEKKILIMNGNDVCEESNKDSQILDIGVTDSKLKTLENKVIEERYSSKDGKTIEQQKLSNNEDFEIVSHKITEKISKSGQKIENKKKHESINSGTINFEIDDSKKYELRKYRHKLADKNYDESTNIVTQEAKVGDKKNKEDLSDDELTIDNNETSSKDVTEGKITEDHKNIGVITEDEITIERQNNQEPTNNVTKNALVVNPEIIVKSNEDRITIEIKDNQESSVDDTKGTEDHKKNRDMVEDGETFINKNDLESKNDVTKNDKIIELSEDSKTFVNKNDKESDTKNVDNNIAEEYDSDDSFFDESLPYSPLSPLKKDDQENDENADDKENKDKDVVFTEETTTNKTVCKETDTSIGNELLVSIDKSKCIEVNCNDQKYCENDHINVTINKNEMTKKSLNNTVVNGVVETNSINGFINSDTTSINLDSESVYFSENNIKSKPKIFKKADNTEILKNPEFLNYLDVRQDAVIDEHPELDQNEIVAYLYKTWLYEETVKSDTKKADELHQSGLVKGLEDKVPVKKLSLSLSKSKQQSNRTKRSNAKSKHYESDNSSINSEDLELPLTSRKKRLIRKLSSLSEEDENSDDKSFAPKSRKDLHAFGFVVNKNHNKDVQQIETSANSQITVEQSKNSDVLIHDNLQSDCTNKEKAIEFDNTSINSEDSEILLSKLALNNSPQKYNEERKNIILGNGKECDAETDLVDSEDSEAPLIKSKQQSKKQSTHIISSNNDIDADRISIVSTDSDVSISKRKKRLKQVRNDNLFQDTEFLKYLELRQDELTDENPQLTHDEIMQYLYKTWLYEENVKSDLKKSDEKEQSNLVKGLNTDITQKKIKKVKADKELLEDATTTTNKPKRKIIKQYYKEDFSDIEDEIEMFEIFNQISHLPNKPVDKDENILKVETTEEIKTEVRNVSEIQNVEEAIIEQPYDEAEYYFSELVRPKPNVFKGLMREKVCEICENIGNLVKCKGCNGMFHIDCFKNESESIEIQSRSRGRKKKKRMGRKPKSLEDSGSQSDDKSHDVSEENNVSFENSVEPESFSVDAEFLETQLTAKMNEILGNCEAVDYQLYSSNDGSDWSEMQPGKCEIVNVILRLKAMDYSDFKCNNCKKYDTPVCFVCKSAFSKTSVGVRQKCSVAHCQKYYHLECLDHWPQTQFNGGEPSRSNKKINEHFEPMSCPRHVCHTCVSDDPRGCKTRFSGDKLARCVRCPATYHSFTKCLPAGSQILTGSHIICPRHYQHRPGKVPCHVNTGWCFICALGGSLICCEYCPTSFHAECLNIDPPEGTYMCEDCETGRLPLYGEMVWVKLGHYRWWPGLILHPCEIPENIMAVKHSLGEFVVRFFGQYDHYWVNRGRVFPFQEGDSGRISSQKSKIDAAFTMAMEHAQRACEILKTAVPNAEESMDIASSLLPPHYVKLKVNRACGALAGRRADAPEGSLTQCECDPADRDPCGPYSQCLNRVLLTECGPICRAGERCNNRAFERRQYPALRPYRTPHRGWGLKALEDLRAGQFVIEYVGELIDEEEFRRRMRRKHEIRDENFYFLTLDKERMIDAGPKGNLARFMNHCCEPNCETQKWTVLGDVRVGLFALRDIIAGSELTFNYNLECAGIEKKRCMCGAKRCSGYIGAKPKQDESQLKKPKRTYRKRKHIEESPSTKTKGKRGRPPKERPPKLLTEIEKDLLIIKNSISNAQSLDDTEDKKPSKRKRVSFSTEEVLASPDAKKSKFDIGD